MAGNIVVDEMATLLSPRQLGYGVLGGAEAAVHVARQFLLSMDTNQAIVKLDFKNIFNSIHRDRMLEVARYLSPTIYPFIYILSLLFSSFMLG